VTDAELLAALEAGTLPPAQFRHRDHVRVAWYLLRDHAPLDAMARFEAALRAYAIAIGAPNLYHATITWTYLLAINERLERIGRAASWADFAAASAELFEPDFVRRYYRAETLASPLARAVFVLPDVAR
jgi:hypothetical protein